MTQNSAQKTAGTSFEKAAGDYLAQLSGMDIAGLKTGADYSRKVPGAYEAVFSDAKCREIHVPAELLPALAASAQGSLKAVIERAAHSVKLCEDGVAAKKERENAANQITDARHKRIAKAAAEQRFTHVRGKDYPEPKPLG